MSALPRAVRRQTPTSRRLLVLSYHFPPSGEVAGKPTARLVRHLPAFGWDAVVVTIPESDLTVPLDMAGYADVIATSRIEKVARWPAPSDGLRALARTLKRRRTGGAASSATATATARGRSGVKDWLMSYLTYPDLQSGWVGAAVRRASGLIRRERFNALLTVAPPHSASVAGWLLRRRFRHLPWVAQMHDPWAGNPFHPAVDRFQARCTAYLERQVVRSADAIGMATEEAAATMAARYPGTPRRRFQVLRNGYDPADFPNVADRTSRSAGPMRFVYAGCLYAGRDPFPFLRVLAKLIADGRVQAADVHVEFIGDCETANGISIRHVAAELGLSDVVSISPPVSYPEALRRLSAADVLLLFAQNQPDQIPAKVYEYLHLNRFILAFTDGASARLLSETGSGRVVGPEDDVESALMDLFVRHRANGLAPSAATNDRLRRYQARPLAGEFAALLNRLVEQRSAGQGGSNGRP